MSSVPLDVEQVGDPSKSFRENNLYVKHLPVQYGDVDLKNLFKGYGTILDCAVLKDHDGNSKRVGFVQMSTAEEAEAALKLHETFLPDEKPDPDAKPLHVAPAHRKEDRQASGQLQGRLSPRPKLGRTQSLPLSPGNRVKSWRQPARRPAPSWSPRAVPPPRAHSIGGMSAFSELGYTSPAPPAPQGPDDLAAAFHSVAHVGNNAIQPGFGPPAPALPHGSPQLSPSPDQLSQGFWVGHPQHVPAMYYPPSSSMMTMPGDAAQMVQFAPAHAVPPAPAPYMHAGQFTVPGAPPAWVLVYAPLPYPMPAPARPSPPFPGSPPPFLPLQEPTRYLQGAHAYP